MGRTPKVQETELDKMQKQFDNFDSQVKELTNDRMNQAPKLETEPQTKMSDREIDNAKKIYLKPKTSISVRDKFNEKFREKYNFSKEYVQFIAENNEIIGEQLEIWTRPFGGIPAEFWQVPVNTPVWGPRYLAEQIRKCTYHRLRMDQTVTHSQHGPGKFYGSMVVDNVIERLTARPVASARSVFMGA